jgi:Glycosyl transferase family 2
MKVVGLMPVRNEAWVLRQSLASLTAFCDVVIVSDQRSEDGSPTICREFPSVVVLESAEARVCEQARWELLDAARGYDGRNLLWWSDADELVSPRLANAWIQSARDRLQPGTAIDCLFYHLWGSADRYRNDRSLYQPHWKSIAVVDDRRMNYDRSLTLPLHEPRVAADGGSRVRAEGVPVFHLQWLLPRRNQMKQAWYRCRELMEGGKSAAEINRRYAIALPAPGARTSAVPRDWIADLTFPDTSVDAEPSWQEREIFTWFDTRGVEFFEALEIWHIAALADEFRRRTWRRPRADRSYLPPWPHRVRRFARRAVRAALRMPF